jgi:hypothetical protein
MQCYMVAGSGVVIGNQSYCHSTSLTCKPSTAGRSGAAFCVACGDKGEPCCGLTCIAGFTCVTPDGGTRDNACE